MEFGELEITYFGWKLVYVLEGSGKGHKCRTKRFIFNPLSNGKLLGFVAGKVMYLELCIRKINLYQETKLE